MVRRVVALFTGPCKAAALLISLGVHVLTEQEITIPPIPVLTSGCVAPMLLEGKAPSPLQISTVQLKITGTPGTVIKNGYVQNALGTRNPIYWALPITVTIPSSGSIRVTAIARTFSAVTANVGTLVMMSTPTAGWTKVTNVSAAAPGEAVELQKVLSSAYVEGDVWIDWHGETKGPITDPLFGNGFATNLSDSWYATAIESMLDKNLVSWKWMPANCLGSVIPRISGLQRNDRYGVLSLVHVRYAFHSGSNNGSYAAEAQVSLGNSRQCKALRLVAEDMGGLGTNALLVCDQTIK